MFQMPAFHPRLFGSGDGAATMLKSSPDGSNLYSYMETRTLSVYCSSIVSYPLSIRLSAHYGPGLLINFYLQET